MYKLSLQEKRTGFTVVSAHKKKEIYWIYFDVCRNKM